MVELHNTNPITKLAARPHWVIKPVIFGIREREILPVVRVEIIKTRGKILYYSYVKSLVSHPEAEQSIEAYNTHNTNAAHNHQQLNCNLMANIFQEATSFHISIAFHG